MKFLAKAVAFHEHPEDEEDSSEEVSSEEDLSDADQQQQQLLGDPKTPPKSQAPAMTPPPRKEEMKPETEDVKVVKEIAWELTVVTWLGQMKDQVTCMGGVGSGLMLVMVAFTVFTYSTMEVVLKCPTNPL